MTDDLFFAITNIPGEYREVLARHGSLDAIDDLLRVRSDPTGWSALERIGHVADSLHASAKCVVAVLDGNRPHHTPVHIEAARAGSNAQPSRAVLAALDAASTDLARAASLVRDDDWERRVLLGDRLICIRDVLEDARNEARHHLREVKGLLDEAERTVGAGT